MSTHLVVFILLLSFATSQDIRFLSPQPFTSYTPSHASPGRLVYQIYATAISNEPTVINYAISVTDSANTNLFAINETNGVITNTAPYPDTPASYNITIQANSSTGTVITGHLIINILPSFLTSPRFERNNYITNIPEDSPVNTSLIVTQAFTLSPTTNNKLYTILSGNTQGAFSISPSTGVISLVNTLDRETLSQYTLTVRYIDDVGTVDASLQILVGDINDNPPLFGESLYHFSIAEDITVNRLVGSVQATDLDEGINQLITYTLSGQYADTFIITTSGELRTQTSLNHESISQYSLIAQARDSGTPRLSSTATVIIDVTNIDDECPIFSGSLYVKDILYDFISPPSIGDYVLTIQANDPDNAGEVTYSIFSGNTGSVFQLDPSTGNITLARNGEDIRGQYDLIVTASDANCINISRALVQIGIGIANEHSPSIDESSCKANLEENPANGTLVTTIVATDDDFGANGLIRYEIVPNTGDYNLFSIDHGSGQVRTVRDSVEYDREERSQFQIGITATDGGFRQDFCLLTITLIDENDNSPIFDLSIYNTTINDVHSFGAYIIQLQAQDMDYGSNGEITYTLSTPLNCPFIINSTTGIITVNTSNQLTETHCSLNATATDNGSIRRSNTAIVNLTILTNGAIPVFTQTNYSVTIEERYSNINAPIINVSANGSQVHYQIITGSEYRTNSEENFDIYSTGSIYITTGIDYERLYPGPYNIRLLVSASINGLFSLTTVTVHITNINDESPEFIDTNQDDNNPPSVTFDVVEGQPPGPIGIVKATDRDIGPFGVVLYRLVNAQEFSNNFTINENNGTIYSKVYGLDAETNNIEYTLVVGAYNQGQLNKEARIRVHIAIEDINDNPPSFSQPVYNVQLNETYLVGKTVVELVATDPDRNDNLVYTILNGNNQAIFLLTSNELKLNRSLDFEVTTHYSLQIQVSDGVHTDTAIVNIQVLDIDDEPPVFNQSIYYGNLVENSPLGTRVLQVNATDLDSSVIRFELKGLAEGRFVISAQGIITVSGDIDREEFLPGEQIVFLVFAYGGSLSTADIILNISDVNDYIPRFIFAPFHGSVPENTPPGENGLYVTTIKAVDLDKDENGTLSYSLISGQANGFSINPMTGIIIANRTYDRESTRYFMLVAMAIDNGEVVQLSSTVEVLVEITDANDNPPYWIYPYMYARVYENAPLGKVVIQLPASDLDNGINATVLFNLERGNEQGKFNLTTDTGEVTVAGSLDYENIGERRYLLYFSIRDSGTPSLSSGVIGELEIHVLDDNDHLPQFAVPSPLSLTIPESSPVGSILTTLTASDGDQGTNSQLNYTLNNNDHFSLIINDNSSVSLITAMRLDYETDSYYELILTATDNGYPLLSTQLYINITLIDVNDHSPVFITNHFTASLYENMASLPVSIIYTEANDPDSDNIPGGLVQQYELVSSDDTNHNFNYNNGWITAVQSLDREQKSEYNFIVRAIDNDPLHPLTSTATVTITVLDRNDNPSADGGQLQILIQSQNVKFPTQELGHVYFIDSDDNDTFTNCQIISGDDHLFGINSSNCILRSLVTDFPAGVSYHVLVRGSDGLHAPVTTTVSIIMHNVSVIPPVSHLITLTLNISGNEYLNETRATFTNNLANLLSVSLSQIILFSSQRGYYDDVNSVDVSLVVMETGSTSYRNITSILQGLYVQRHLIQMQNLHILYSLPIDLCLTEPCLNQGECRTVTSIQPLGTSRLTSKWFILFTPIVTFSYQCTCPLGTTGRHCEINYDDCYSNPCQYGGSCTDGIQEYYCQCPSGTSGVDCSINNDECLSDPCHNGATCINGFGVPICQCPTGYYGNMCQYAYFSPPSFCDSSPCLNNGTCSSGRDSYTCICTSEYTGQFCQQRAQYQGGCVNNPCYNGSTCTEETNGYTCTCSVGFTGPNCRFPLNNCELEYCRNGGTCERGLYGAFNCLCPAGYGGQYCTQLLSLCYSSPCLNGGTCTGNTTDYTCECPREYYGTNCQLAINPPNLCLMHSLCQTGSVCTSGRNNYTCLCTDGAVGTYCNQSFNNPNPCDINPCSYGGQCTVNGSDEYTCTCQPGFTGTDCRFNIDDCSNNPCLNNGTCTDGFGHYTCTCNQGYTGRECQVYCPVGHIGERCQNNINYCTPTSCNNGGTCIEEHDTFTCTCPPMYTGKTCTVMNDCNINTCYNGGTCSNSISSGYTCQCTHNELKGPHCELTTVSFTGDSNTPSYRAYNPLTFTARGFIQFDFATQSRTALLLLNTQYQYGSSDDFIAVEISNGYLLISYSLGQRITNNLTVLSTSVEVADGKWHTLLLAVKGKRVEATLDYCIELMDTVLSSTLDCTSSVSPLTNYSVLNLGLPLWLGGAPMTALSSLPSSLSAGSNACIRNVLLNDVLLDLGSYADQERSQNGCPQIDDTCTGVSCGEGTCITQWNNYYCYCPQQVTGRHCSEDAQGLTYDGQTLSQYNLRPLARGRTRRQTSPSNLTHSVNLSNYRENISLWFRTESDDGLILLIGNMSSEYILAKLQGGRLIYNIKLDVFSQMTTVSVSSNLHNGLWHFLNISRIGINSQIQVDHTHKSHAHSSSSITLEYMSNEFYIAGRLDNQAVADGYTGCIQDVRLDHTPLPVTDSNEYASITHIGGVPDEGCRVGPCHPNPCHTGNCSETNPNVFLCTCLDGSTQTTPCENESNTSAIIGIAVATAIAIFIVILIIVLIIGLITISKYEKRKGKRYSLSDTALGRSAQRNGSNFEIHANIHTYDEEGGEEDTPLNNIYEPDTTDSPTTLPKPFVKYSPNMSTLDRDRHLDDTPTKLKLATPLTKPFVQHSPADTPPTGTTPPVRGTPKGTPRTIYRPATPPRASTPDIDAFIEDKVNKANCLITDLDSLKDYSDEGLASSTGSLSLLSVTSLNKYTFEQLRRAGPDFQHIADILEPVYMDDEEEQSEEESEGEEERRGERQDTSDDSEESEEEEEEREEQQEIEEEESEQWEVTSDFESNNSSPGPTQVQP